MSLPAVDQAGIVQFGTGRFLLGHVAALVGESLEAGHSRDGILVVQSSTRPEGKAKARALAERRRYPLRIRGRLSGRDVDIERQVESVAGCLIADEQWPVLENHVIEVARYVVSNTGDCGYWVGDDSSLAEVPASFPGKLTKLLRARFLAGRDGLVILPCELIAHNGQVLKRTVMAMARRDHDDADFMAWLDERCQWADTLVDRIVSEALEPVGAVAEPYALWAIRARPGVTLPCRHRDVRLVEDLAPFELRKLHILNLAHTCLVHLWRTEGFEERLSLVREAMAEPRLHTPLLSMLNDEVLPTLARELPDAALEAYRDSTLERFANPFLDHRLGDIAQYHPQKLQRRLQPVIDMARRHGIATPGLCRATGHAPTTTT